ncbi:MAG: UDP-N-acetylmuramyl-tripeptide synthetase, partial [Spirochaetaceae bacterium]
MHASRLAVLLTRSRLLAGDQAQIIDVTNDSRAVRPGWLYAALPGARVDGHRFIPDAIAAGATGILCEHPPETPDPGVAWFVTDEPRVALSELSDALFEHPSRDVQVVGVTGTDGKTSTVSFVHQLLRALGHRSGYLSSAAIAIGGDERSNPEHQSTPEAPEVHRALRTMADAGDRYAVIESTSHGLSMKTARLAHVRYAASVLTNMAHEHLEFHGTFEQYRFDKANLFRALGTGRPLADIVTAGEQSAPVTPGRPHGAQPRRVQPALTLPFGEAFGVLNADDPVYDYFRSATAAPTLSYSLRSGGAIANVYASEIDPSPASTSFVLHTPIGSSRCTMPIPGPFNVANVLAASAVIAGLVAVRVEDLVDAIASLRPVRGRMNVVLTTPFTVVVDFAHTPGSFDAVLPFFREHTPGRLIVLFGSAGERDP